MRGESPNNNSFSYYSNMHSMLGWLFGRQEMETHSNHNCPLPCDGECEYRTRHADRERWIALALDTKIEETTTSLFFGSAIVVLLHFVLFYFIHNTYTLVRRKLTDLLITIQQYTWKRTLLSPLASSSSSSLNICDTRIDAHRP